MSQAEELLNQVAGDETYTTTPETEPHIVIGADRFITVPDELKRLGVQGDKDIETVTFDCPRYWDDTDMSEMSVAINIQRKDGVSDKYLADNVVVDSEDQSMMHFDWTISKFVAEVKGALRFNVCISSVDESGKEVEHWNSEVCEDCYISEGLETDKQIVEAYPDVITQLRTTMENLLNSGMAVDVTMQKTDGVLTVNIDAPEGTEQFKIYDGKTPFIGANGNWWIGEKDTGVTAAASTEGMMPSSVYDPQGKATDIYKYIENFLEVETADGIISSVTINNITNHTVNALKRISICGLTCIFVDLTLKSGAVSSSGGSVMIHFYLPAGEKAYGIPSKIPVNLYRDGNTSRTYIYEAVVNQNGSMEQGDYVWKLIRMTIESVSGDVFVAGDRVCFNLMYFEP